jgi:molybdenum cofactor cytidylyltransferase
VLFHRALFSELQAVQGDRGGRQVVARYQEQVERVVVDDVAVTADVDTCQDYETARKVGNDSRSRG